MYFVRVGRNGRITLPAQIRERMNIGEGTLLEVKENPQVILLGSLPEIKIGRIVGKKKYEKIIQELDQLRNKWR